MSRLGETFACARCGRPVVRTSCFQRYCSACGAAAHRERCRENARRMAAKLRAGGESPRPACVNGRSWAARRAAALVESMLRKERLLSEIGRERPTRVYVWRDSVVEWRGTHPNY